MENLLNFGPLNKEGGWKRLNVAVSRARSEMLVFTTMTADMIDLKRTKSKGVESLKNFLGFAEKGRLQFSCNEMIPKNEQGILDRFAQNSKSSVTNIKKTLDILTLRLIWQLLIHLSRMNIFLNYA